MQQSHNEGQASAALGFGPGVGWNVNGNGATANAEATVSISGSQEAVNAQLALLGKGALKLTSLNPLDRVKGTIQVLPVVEDMVMDITRDLVFGATKTGDLPSDLIPDQVPEAILDQTPGFPFFGHESSNRNMRELMDAGYDYRDIPKNPLELSELAHQVRTAEARTRNANNWHRDRAGNNNDKDRDSDNDGGRSSRDRPSRDPGNASDRAVEKDGMPGGGSSHPGHPSAGVGGGSSRDRGNASDRAAEKDGLSGGSKNPGHPSAYPIILDLDGDGIEVTELTHSRTFFDFDDDEYKEVTAWAGNDTVWGTDGSDIITGGFGADVMHGGGGHDVIFTDDEDDLGQVSGGAGFDTLTHSSWTGAAQADYDAAVQPPMTPQRTVVLGVMAL